MPLLLFPSVDVLAGVRSRGLAGADPVTPTGEPIDVAAIRAHFEAMSPKDLERFLFYLNQRLDQHPLGERVKSLANSRRLGLGFLESLATIGTTLATTALALGVDLYDKKKARDDAADSEKRAYAAEVKKIEAAAKKAAAETKAKATAWGTYALYGTLGLGVLALVGFVALRRS